MPTMIKAFKTVPATITNTYSYTFTERDIRRSDGYRLVISRGNIVPDQFTAIHRMLYAVNIIRSGLTPEAQSVQRGPRSKVKTAPVEEGTELVPLHSAVGMLETQLEAITNAWAATAPEASESADIPLWRSPGFRFRAHADRIAPLLDDLKRGNWYGNPDATRTTGVSSIEVIGDRLFGLLLDLVWEMDNATHVSTVPAAADTAAPAPAVPKKTAMTRPHAVAVLASEDEIEEELGGLMGTDSLDDMKGLTEYNGDFDRFSEPE